MKSFSTKIYDKLLRFCGFEEVNEEEIIEEIARTYKGKKNIQVLEDSLNSSDRKEDFYIVDNETEKTVVSMIAKDKAVSMVELFLMSGLFILFVLALSRLVNALEFTNTFILLIVFLISISYLNYKIFQYRVRKGLYGTNEAESREIIAYVLSIIQYLKGNGKKDITINEDVVEQVYELISKSGHVKTGENHA